MRNGYETGSQSGNANRRNRPLRFVLVGALNTILGLTVIYLCKFFLDMSDVSANLIGYLVGLINSFMLNAKWTFGYEGALLVPAFKFLLTFAIAYAMNLLALIVLIETLLVNSYLAHAIAIAPYTVTFYLLSILYVFRSENSYK